MKSVVRLTDRPDMTLDVYRGQQQQKKTIHTYIHVYIGRFANELIGEQSKRQKML